jgi:hypothetical protein
MRAVSVILFLSLISLRISHYACSESVEEPEESSSTVRRASDLLKIHAIYAYFGK